MGAGEDPSFAAAVPALGGTAAALGAASLLPPVPAPSGGPTLEDVGRYFAAHEEWYRTATLKRQEVRALAGGVAGGWFRCQAARRHRVGAGRRGAVRARVGTRVLSAQPSAPSTGRQHVSRALTHRLRRPPIPPPHTPPHPYPPTPQTYRALQGDCVELLRTLAEGEGRSAGLLGRIGELEALIADERSRWSQKLAEDAAVAK